MLYLFPVNVRVVKNVTCLSCLVYSPGCITPTFIKIMIAEDFFNCCIKDIMELKTMKGLALDDILAEVHTYVHRG